MTISNQQSSVTDDGDGLTTQFAYTFLIPASVDVLVSITDTTVSPAVTTIIPSSQYTITGIDTSEGGLVTYPLAGPALPSGWTITIARALPIVQTTPISNQGNFYASAVEGALDYATMVMQDLQQEINVIDATLADLTASDVTIISNVTNAVATRALMKAAAVSAPNVGTIIYMEGLITAGDGGGGIFLITNVNPGADDGGVIIWSDTSGFYFVRQPGNSPYSIKWYGATGLDSADDGPAIQATINAVHALGGGTVVFPPGTYKHTSQLTFYNDIQYLGAGYECCQLHYTGTSDQAIISNPINSSTIANIYIFGLYFNGPNIVTPHGCLFDTGSSLVTIEQCYFWGGYMGLIMNQSELWQVRDCYFNGNAHGVWFVNGDARTVSASQMFTNRISFDGCQFNVTSIAIVDDGGVAHTFNNCNINAGTVWARIASCLSFYMSGCECESPSVCGIQFESTFLAGGAAPYWTSVATIVGNFLSTSAIPVFNVVASSVRKLFIEGNTFNASVTLFNGTANEPDELVSIANHDVNPTESNLQDSTVNNYFDPISYTPTWSSSGTAVSLGNGTIVGSYERRGRSASYFCQLTAGSTTTYGSGVYRFSVPVSPSGQSGQGAVGTAFIACNSKVYPGAVVYRAPYVNIATNAGNDFVGPSTPDTFTSGDSISFTFQFITANKLG